MECRSASLKQLNLLQITNFTQQSKQGQVK